MPASAVVGDEVVFDPSFSQPLNPNPGRPFGIRAMVYLENTFYAYLGDAIYVWKPDDPKPTLYCSLPTTPIWKETWGNTMFKDLPDDEQAELAGAVDYIAGGDGALWGYNMLSGRIGKISRDGIAWSRQPLNTADFFKNGRIALYFMPIQSFVEDGQLYIFGNNDGIKSLNATKPLLRFDMASGEYTILETKQARNLCPYQPGSILLARRGNKASMRLSVMDLKTGTMKDLQQTVPFPDKTDEGLASIGGLSYDPHRDQIYFVMEEDIVKSNVWQSREGEPFEIVKHLPTMVHTDVLAWVLPDGRYAFYVMDGLYVCALN